MFKVLELDTLEKGYEIHLGELCTRNWEQIIVYLARKSTEQIMLYLAKKSIKQIIVYFTRKDWGSGLAELLIRSTLDCKVAGSTPGFYSIQ